MQNPLEVTFHDLQHNDNIEEIIQEKFEKLKSISPDITKCHIILEKLSKHHQSGNTACARLDIKIPHFEDIIISEKCDETEASLSHTVIKIFKRGKGLVREEIKRRHDKHRNSKEVILEKPTDEFDEDDF